MSRIKIKDLFAEARDLKMQSQRVDLRWIKIQRSCIRQLGRLEAESLRISKELNKTMRKLERAGFSMTDIFERIRPEKPKKRRKV